MNRLVLGIFLFFGVVLNSFSQKSLSDYSYVIVSEQFEFQKEKDKYQLNSLTKFLFNKYGFHAYFDRELPVNLKRCDGLWAEAEGTPGFIITKVQLVLRDCNGLEVYRTQFGNSKVKDYKKAYYEAMRETFEEIRAMEVQQKEIEEIELIKLARAQNSSIENESQTKVNTVETSDAPLNIEPVKNETIVVASAFIKSLPKAKYTTYRYSGKTYLLRKTSSGYTLYQELLGEEDDLLLKGRVVIEDPNLYFESDEKEKLKASFDESNNLIVGEGKEEIKYKFEN